MCIWHFGRAVGEQHLWTWHVPNLHKCVLLGKEFMVEGVSYISSLYHNLEKLKYYLVFFKEIQWISLKNWQTNPNDPSYSHSHGSLSSTMNLINKQAVCTVLEYIHLTCTDSSKKKVSQPSLSTLFVRTDPIFQGYCQKWYHRLNSNDD